MAKKKAKSDDKFYNDTVVNDVTISKPLVEETAPEIGMDSGDESIQVPYFPASASCNTLDTVVPNAMAIEQKKFNQMFKAAMIELGTTVDEWVAKKLHYKSATELCVDENGAVRFSQEQIDGVGTAIWNYENTGDAIIIADQTGVGKGRMAAGLMRYAILELKVTPFFFTEKKHLINDIYRDLIAIGFDAGVPYKIKKTIKVDRNDFNDEEILKIIRDDIKENDEIRVEYSFADDFELGWLRKSIDDTHPKFDYIESVKDEIIALYRQDIIENGLEKEVYESNPDYDRQVVDALRKGRYLLTPFVPNKMDIKDTEGNILYPAITNEEIANIYRFKKEGRKYSEDPTVKASEMILPDRFKLFAMPYSQVGTAYYKFNGEELLKSKIKLFQKYSHDSVIILDESHTAAGLNESTGELSNTGELIYQFVKNSKMTTYLSATYAKRASNMPLYALRTSIRESGLSDMEMINAFRKGGNALQEAVSAELTRNGQLLRREKIIQGKSEYYYESDQSEIGLNQIAKLDRIAKLYSSVLDFSDKVRAIIREYKKGLTSQDAAKIKPARSVNALTFQLFNFMLLGLKVRQTTEFAIKNLREGKKTVITVASTLESALDNLSKTFQSNASDDSYKIGDTIKNDFALYMAYLLNYTLRYYTVEIKVSDDGFEEETKQLVYVLDADDELSEMIKDRLIDEYKVILKTILDTDTGIPIAPIDQIKQVIKSAGFKMDEITGRQRCINFEKGDFAEGVISKRDIKKTDLVVREFNENEIDCLIINQSGAVGISMHALPNKKVDIVYEPTIEGGVTTENAPKSLENKKEVKKRAMIITQMDLDINKEVQKLGRINRTGQVYVPEYTYVISAIPSESRLTSLMEKKLRSLSANVSSNQEQASYLFSADDFFSDMAVPPFNETMIEVGMRGIQVTVGSQIQDFTKSLYFKQYELQRDFYATFSKRLTKEIETLTAQGLYTGKMSSKDYYAITKETFPFFIGDNNAKTSFGRHSFIEKSSVTLYKEKNTEKNIGISITDRLHLKTSNDNADAGIFFSTIPAFQTKAIAMLDSHLKEKQLLIGRYAEEIDNRVAEIKALLTEKQTELSKFKQLEEGIAIENKLKEVNDLISGYSGMIQQAAMAGDMTKIQELTQSIQTYTAERTELDAKIIPYKEVLQNKGDHKELLRAIKNLEAEMSRVEIGRARHYESLEEYTRLVLRGKSYIEKIGTINQLNVYDENKIPVEEMIGNYDYRVEYSLKHQEPVVITGVSFSHDYSELTPGKFDIFVSGVSEKYTYNLYQLHREYEDEKIAVGYKPTISMDVVDANYKGKWNSIAGKVDNSYREDRFFIIGSLLRTFTLANNNDITGQIVKYNTDSKKVRIGIEIADSKDMSNGKKSVYKVLTERYNTETQLNHPVYYDGNVENINRYMTEYMYEKILLDLYSDVENGITDSDKAKSNRDISANTEFMFQVSSSDKQIYIVVRMSDNLYSHFDEIETAQFYSNDDKGIKVPSLKKWGIETFAANLEVSIVSNSVNATDFFAVNLKQLLNIEINNNNYTINTKSKYFPDLYAEKNRSGRIGKIYGQGLFEFLFPTNIISVEDIMSYGFEYVSKLYMKYSDLMELFKAFDAKKRKPTMATSSGYFERFKGGYVFEQFNDEQANIANVAGNLVFESNETIAEKEVSSMIDKLVSILSKTENNE